MKVCIRIQGAYVLAWVCVWTLATCAHGRVSPIASIAKQYTHSSSQIQDGSLLIPQDVGEDEVKQNTYHQYTAQEESQEARHSLDEDDFYTAAAIIYSSLGEEGKSATYNLQYNIGVLSSYIADASQQGAQIVVTPELALFGVGLKKALKSSNDVIARSIMRTYAVELPSANPQKERCRDPNSVDIIEKLSCIAKKNAVVLVVNLIEVVDNLYARDSFYLYNTDIVFDENSNVIAKYRKQHLFGTSRILDQPSENQPVSFRTSFGVEFGIFICFDIEFKDPAQDLLERGVRHFVYNTAWWNTPPVQYASEIQAGWSRASKAVLIASNIGISPLQSGSGIYYGGQIYTEHFNMHQNDEDMVICAAIPKKNPEPNGPAQKSSRIAPPPASSDIFDEATVCQLQFMEGVQANASCLAVSNAKSLQDGQKNVYARIQSLDKQLNCSLALNVQKWAAHPGDGKVVFAAYSHVQHYRDTIDAIDMKFCMAFYCYRNFPDCEATLLEMGTINSAEVIAKVIKNPDVVLPLSSSVTASNISPTYVQEYETNSGDGKFFVKAKVLPEDGMQNLLNFGIYSLSKVED